MERGSPLLLTESFFVARKGEMRRKEKKEKGGEIRGTKRP